MIERLIPRKYRWATSIAPIDAEKASPATKAIAHDLIGFLARMAEAEKRRKTFRVLKTDGDR